MRPAEHLLLEFGPDFLIEPLDPMAGHPIGVAGRRQAAQVVLREADPVGESRRNQGGDGVGTSVVGDPLLHPDSVDPDVGASRSRSLPEGASSVCSSWWPIRQRLRSTPASARMSCCTSPHREFSVWLMTGQPGLLGGQGRAFEDFPLMATDRVARGDLDHPGAYSGRHRFHR